MGYKLIIASEVENDLQESIDWYNEKQPGLGARFLNEVKKTIALHKKKSSCYCNTL
jgi:hypothetical protein